MSRKILSHILLLAGLLSFAFTSGALAAPTAPTGLRGTVVASNPLVLIWNDNSTDETNFEIAYTINGGSAGTFLAPGPSAGTGTLN